MERRLKEQKLEEAKPEVLIRLSEEITVLSGFPRAAECIAAGEEAAAKALPTIRKILGQRRWFKWRKGQ